MLPLTLHTDPVESAPAATAVTIKSAKGIATRPFLGRDVFQIGELVASNTPLDRPLAKLVAEYVGCSQSFSERVKLRLTEHVTLLSPLYEDLATTVVEYVIDYEKDFGVKEYQEYYGVDVGPGLPFSKDLIDWWLGSDPLEPSQPIYDTHLPPVLRPQTITHLDTHTQQAFSFNSLEKIVATPKKGNAGHYAYRSPALLEHGNTPAGPACLLVMRKGVLFRDKQPYDPIGGYDEPAAYAKQQTALKALNATIKKGMGYVSETSALDLATIVFTRHTVTGERHLSDGTGIEKYMTQASCKEKAKFPNHPVTLPAFHVNVGGFDSFRETCVSTLATTASAASALWPCGSSP